MDALLPILDFLQQLADGEIPASKDVRDRAKELLNDYYAAQPKEHKAPKPK